LIKKRKEKAMAFSHSHGQLLARQRQRSRMFDEESVLQAQREAQKHWAQKEIKPINFSMVEKHWAQKEIKPINFSMVERNWAQKAIYSNPGLLISPLLAEKLAQIFDMNTSVTFRDKTVQIFENQIRLRFDEEILQAKLITHIRSVLHDILTVNHSTQQLTINLGKDKEDKVVFGTLLAFVIDYGTMVVGEVILNGKVLINRTDWTNFLINKDLNDLLNGSYVQRLNRIQQVSGRKQHEMVNHDEHWEEKFSDPEIKSRRKIFSKVNENERRWAQKQFSH
jgi:hypothetical protein